MQSAAIYMAAFSLISIHISNALSSISLALCILLLVASTPIKALQNGGIVLTVLILFQIIWQTVFYTWDAESWKSIQVKSILFFGPWFVASLDNSKSRNGALFILALFMAWISIPAVLNYFADLHFWNEMISQSKPLAIYSQIYHIEYSFILSLVAISCFYIDKLPKPVLPIYLRILGLVLVICLHVLSTRTGLVAFYAGLLPLAFSKWKNLQFKHRILGIVFIISMLCALYLIPSIQHRVNNSLQDLGTVVNAEKVNNQSFGQRFISWKASANLIESQTLQGCGISNVNESLKTTIVNGNYAIDSYFIVAPHNVFLELAIQSGILAMLLFLAFLVLIAIKAYLIKNWYLLGVVLSITVASNFETLIERQSGVLALALFILFATRVKSVEQKTG